MNGTTPIQPHFVVTVDVEDWFQVENLKAIIAFDKWPAIQLRVEQNTIKILDLLEQQPTPVKATFFVLGWVAKRCPDLVKEISIRGHELASHGSNHDLCSSLSHAQLSDDLQESRELLSEISGSEVVGYRAPSFSISDETITIVRDAGYSYDSSYNSFQHHGRYGSLTIPGIHENSRRSAHQLTPGFYEIPLSNLQVGATVLPWAGGGYFRLLPTLLFNSGVKRILRQQGTYVFYLHPWELDPDQPKVRGLKSALRFKHYVNLDKTQAKLEKLLTTFSHCRFCTCRDLLIANGF